MVKGGFLAQRLRPPPLPGPRQGPRGQLADGPHDGGGTVLNTVVPNVLAGGRDTFTTKLCQKHAGYYDLVLPVDEVAPVGDGEHSVLSFKALDLVVLTAFHVDVRANTLVLKAESVELNLKVNT